MLLGLSSAITASYLQGKGVPAPEFEFDFGVATSGDEEPGVEATTGQSGYIVVSGDARE